MSNRNCFQINYQKPGSNQPCNMVNQCPQIINQRCPTSVMNSGDFQLLSNRLQIMENTNSTESNAIACLQTRLLCLEGRINNIPGICPQWCDTTNTSLGSSAFPRAINTGSYNTGLGAQALSKNRSGSQIKTD